MKKIILLTALLLAPHFNTFCFDSNLQNFMQKCEESHQELAQILNAIDQAMLNLEQPSKSQVLQKTALMCLHAAQIIGTTSIRLFKRSVDLFAQHG